MQRTYLIDELILLLLLLLFFFFFCFFLKKYKNGKREQNLRWLALGQRVNQRCKTSLELGSSRVRAFHRIGSDILEHLRNQGIRRSIDQSHLIIKQNVTILVQKARNLNKKQKKNEIKKNESILLFYPCKRHLLHNEQ